MGKDLEHAKDKRKWIIALWNIVLYNGWSAATYNLYFYGITDNILNDITIF